VAAAIDHLAELDVDTSAVVTVGHSAGGHLAVWAAGRHLLPAGAPGAQPGVRITAAVAQAGVLDLATAARERVGGTAVPDLLGGSPAAVPERYELADPMYRIPLPQPVLCVHSRADESVPYAQSEAYVVAARAAGAPALLHEVPGDHMAVIDPATPAWGVVRAALPDLLGGRLPSPS
jgi:acetyl esterase/lipase